MSAGAKFSRIGKLRKQSEARLGSFEIFQLGRDYRLSALDRWLLVTLSMLCDWETGEYAGTKTELAWDTGASRKAISASIKRLAAADLIQIVADFDVGVRGELRVLALDRIRTDVKPVVRAEPREKRRPHVEPFTPRHRVERREARGDGLRADFAPTSRPLRDDIASNDASAPPLTSTDASPVRNQAPKGARFTDEVPDNVRAIDLLTRELGAEVVQ